MSVVLTDAEISALVAEPKPLPKDYQSQIVAKPKRGHKESELSVTGKEGSNFVIIVRVSNENALDFSVILGYDSPNSNERYLLRRYNGKSHEHTNKIEGLELPYDFHIHSATERYKSRMDDEVGYAETTDRYADLDGAVECLIKDCGFILPPGETPSMFAKAGAP